MSSCSDKELGQLLHDYELGLLSQEETDSFEMHLYECEYCLAQVREFMDVSRILIKDSDAGALIEKVASESGTGEAKKKPSPFLRILIAAVLVAVVLVPIYRYGIYKETTGIVQTLELLSTRTGGNDIIYLEKDGDVSISFYVNPNYHGRVDLYIANIAGDTVLFEQDFSNINDEGLGEIILPISLFKEGHYMLIARPVTDSIGVSDIQYMFRVK